jgi:hypothetical protein
MRLLFLSAFLILPSASALAADVAPARDMPVINPAREAANCPETPMSLARKRAERPYAIPLTKLPPAQTFLAVDRRIGGCPAPFTMIEYRNPRRR